jgi:hypothetical protein
MPHPIPTVGTGSSDVDTVRKMLEELSEAIEKKRRSLNHGAPARAISNSDWAEMLRLHCERQLKAEERASLKGQIIEGFRFDLDILRHAFGRWLTRVDRTF